ncbi:MAG: hypothetical protein RSD88_07435 [Anaerovoracaceae bacterium]
MRQDEDLNNKLVEYAKQEELSKNQVVRKAIRKLIEKNKAG